ncbi:MAG: sigma-70 family RNA polymerase sigma factor [Christensenellaceae bacterium]|nr:sigma-70 family RNA polymerase sigma factor [Christensenellaceae bacterium]
MINKDIYAKFDEVYDKTFNLISAMATAKCARLEDVKDIVQETYAEYFNTLKKKGIAYAQNDGGFVVAVLRSVLFKHYKGRENEKNTLVSLTPYEENVSDIEDSALSIFEVSEKKESISLVLAELKKKDLLTQKIFAMFYYSDMKIKEIGALLEVSESLVKHKLYGTITELKLKLGGMV